MNQSDIHFLWRDLGAAGVMHDDQHIILSNDLHTRLYASFLSANIPNNLREQLLRWAMDELAKVAVDNPVFLGIGCGYWYAAQVAQRMWSNSVYAERATQGHFVLRRDQGRMLTGKSVIIVDDVLVGGTTLTKLIALTRSYGGTPIASTVFLNRSGRPFVNAEGPYVPMHCMHEQQYPTWIESECPMCKAGIPFSTQHGKGAEVFHLKGQPQA